MAKAKKKKQWRFYRSNLSTVVWDKENDKPLVDFSSGYITTDKEEVAKTLLKYGYLEIPLDSVEPPSDVIIHQPATVIDGDVPIMKSKVVSESVVEARMGKATKEINLPKLKLKKEVKKAVKKRKKIK